MNTRTRKKNEKKNERRRREQRKVVEEEEEIDENIKQKQENEENEKNKKNHLSIARRAFLSKDFVPLFLLCVLLGVENQRDEKLFCLIKE